MRFHIALCLVAGTAMFSAILLTGEVVYRRQFREALEQLQQAATKAHQPERLAFTYARYSRMWTEPEVSFIEDLFEAGRMRVPRCLGTGSRLNPRTSASAAYAYLAVDVSHDISGEMRTTHTFIWSPRERRFALWLGNCGLQGCPARN
jgi:hypothetical protein